MRADKYLILYLRIQKLPSVAGGNYWEKLVCHKISYAAYLLLMP